MVWESGWKQRTRTISLGLGNRGPSGAAPSVWLWLVNVLRILERSACFD